jgi:hypothetical protein
MPTPTPSTIAISTRRGVMEFETSLTWEEAMVELGRVKDSNEFAASLYSRGESGKYMSPVQVAWVYKLAQDELDKTSNTSGTSGGEGTSTPLSVPAQEILASLIEANFKGLKRPVLRFVVETLGDSSLEVKYMTMGKNAGGAWITLDGELAGKIGRDGEFVCYEKGGKGAAILSFIELVNSNLTGAVVEYGRATGKCGCCGRTLTRQDSIDRGIGPICAENFGLG